MSAWAQLLEWDEAILVSVRRWQRPVATRVCRALTHLGDGASWGLIGVVLLLASHDTRELAFRLTAAAGAATVVSQLLKRLLNRPRPSQRVPGFVALVQDPDAFSFPSGHTAAAVAVAVAWAGSGTGLGAVVALLALGVAGSRVYLGAHYPLDVFCGGLIGLLAGAATRLFI